MRESMPIHSHLRSSRGSCLSTCATMVVFTIAAIYAPTTADVDVECPLQTAAVELALGRRPACGRQKGRPPAAQSRSASLPMGHQPQPMLRRPSICGGTACGIGGPASAVKLAPPCFSNRT